MAAKATATETIDPAILAELTALRAENAALKSSKADGLTFKVSEKGAVSVYGLGRFPTTLYAEQWAVLLQAGERLQAFIADNAGQLKVKA